MISAFKEREVWPHSLILLSLEIKDYDLSAKNPANIKEIIHRAPNEIMEDIIRINESIVEATSVLRTLVK